MSTLMTPGLSQSLNGPLCVETQGKSVFQTYPWVQTGSSKAMGCVGGAKGNIVGIKTYVPTPPDLRLVFNVYEVETPDPHLSPRPGTRTPLLHGTWRDGPDEAEGKRPSER